MIINGRKIAASEPPYVIAEMSANHNGSIKNAEAIIAAAKQAGADAVKIQTYKPDTITLDADSEEFMVRGGVWDGRRLFDLYEDAHMPWEWHKPLFDFAREVGITIFSTPFDTTAVDLLEDLNTPAYKIASFEAVDLPLIRYVASTGKPMIISTGMANGEEIAEAIDSARAGGCRELAILHCVSGYPAPAEDYNLRTIPEMMSRYGVMTGLSDHTLDNTTAIAAVALGAVIVEKHFTLNRNGGGPDDSFSLEPDDLTALCLSTKVAWSALGRITFERKKSEQGNLKFRRSLYSVADIQPGETFTSANVRSIRPGFGLAPKHLDHVLGKTADKFIARGTPISWELVRT